MPKRTEGLSEGKEQPDIPRWRRIEIMREKAQLREALGDLDGDPGEYDEEVFGSDEEYMSFHEHSEVPEDELTEPDETELPDDDFEDFEDD